jgi:hypothetical protein
LAKRDSFLFTSESVTEGHPDKIADQISDAILDACLAEDPFSRVACETLTCTGLVVIAGEITTKAYVDFQSLVRGTVASIGYDNALYGFDSNTCAVISTINKQSGDIAMGVDTGGAGDQGMMFGYATNETPELMPTPISLAHKLTKKLSEVRKSGLMSYLRPDGKSQVTVEYDANHKPVRVDAVVISTQHAEHIGNEELRADILKHVIQAVIPAKLLDAGHQVPHQPDRAVCYRRSDGRHRIDRAQDHRRHVWRHGPSWRWRVQRQGPNQGGPLGGVHGALRGEEHCRCGVGGPLRGAAWPTRSVWQSRSACWSTRSAPARWTRTSSRRWCARTSR